MILEVCVDSIISLKTAIKAGADRIELCSALNLGGLTPSYGLLKEASKINNIDIAVVIRLLTSGGEKTAEKGIGYITKINECYGHLITIMPG